MDQGSATMNSAGYPVLSLPKKCTALETNCELNISTINGFSNVKLIDSYDMNHYNTNESAPTEDNDNDLISVLVDESGNQVADSSNQSQVWIDPARSPFVYNDYGRDQHQQVHYSNYYNTGTNHIAVEQRNTYITHVNNYNKEPKTYPTDEFEHKKFQKVQVSESSTQENTTDPNYNLYVEDEFERGVFLSPLSEEIPNDKETPFREEQEHIGIPSEDGALKQLMSSDTPSSKKARKTILFLGHDSHYGRTIQKIAMNDPYWVCSVKDEANSQVVSEEPDFGIPGQKKYQCDKCKQVFDRIIEFRQHMVGGNISPRNNNEKSIGNIEFLCSECGKHFKSHEKFEQHMQSHGDPDLECSKCHKVFVSRATLRAHNKIHSREFGCEFCSKTYTKIDGLRGHVAKAHCIFMCEHCDFKSSDRDAVSDHQMEHNLIHEKSDFDTLSAVEDSRESEIIKLNTEVVDNEEVARVKDEDIRRADSVIAKVMSNEIFGATGNKRQSNKVCDVCRKKFNRAGDLKRHLIEHILKSTLAKIPVARNGTLDIQCEVCQAEKFTKVDSYKAHLREHAKLTAYKCTFCDKSFSDSSNFSKHKKIHGSPCLLCDLCDRKFTSKRMLIVHMEHHYKHKPIPCQFCRRIFHFQSTLKKHIKCAHPENLHLKKFKCRFCCHYSESFKEKSDHEWFVHNVRKTAVDCPMCNSKFRKQTELKIHCYKVHDVEIPKAKELRSKQTGPV